MNYIREAEKYLKHYKDLKYSLEQIDREIYRLQMSSAPKDIKAVNFDGVPHAEYYQDNIFNIAFQLKVFTEAKEQTLARLEEIDRILEDIGRENKNYEKILRMWYIEKRPWEEIAEGLQYSPKSRNSIYELKNEAIRKFAVMLFGIGACSQS